MKRSVNTNRILHLQFIWKEFERYHITNKTYRQVRIALSETRLGGIQHTVTTPRSLMAYSISPNCFSISSISVYATGLRSNKVCDHQISHQRSIHPAVLPHLFLQLHSLRRVKVNFRSTQGTEQPSLQYISRIHIPSVRLEQLLIFHPRKGVKPIRHSL